MRALRFAAMLLAVHVNGAARQCEWNASTDDDEVRGLCGTLGTVPWADMLPNGYLDAYADLRAATLSKFYIAPGHNPEAFGGIVVRSEKDLGQHYIFPLICDDSDESRIRLEESIRADPVLREQIHGPVAIAAPRVGLDVRAKRAMQCCSNIDSVTIGRTQTFLLAHAASTPTP